MKNLAISLVLVLAPILMPLYYKLGKLLLRNSDAARWLTDDVRGSIDRGELDSYETYLTLFVVLGFVASIIVAVALSRQIDLWLSRRGSPSGAGTDRPDR